MSNFFKKQKKASFNDIIWKTLEKISEKSSFEFRKPQKKTVLLGSWSETSVEEDSRKSYTQLVEFLSDIFLHEFNPEHEKEYKEIMKKVEVLKNQFQRKEIDVDDYVISKLELMRELLRLTMRVLKHHEYLKGFGYFRSHEEQGDDDDDDDEAEGDIE